MLQAVQNLNRQARELNDRAEAFADLQAADDARRKGRPPRRLGSPPPSPPESPPELHGVQKMPSLLKEENMTPGETTWKYHWIGLGVLVALLIVLIAVVIWAATRRA